MRNSSLFVRPSIALMDTPDKAGNASTLMRRDWSSLSGKSLRAIGYPGEKDIEKNLDRSGL